MDFITSYYVRNGEFEGNEYVINKIDQTNYIIFSEYKYEDGIREIHAAEVAYRENLIKRINEYASKKHNHTFKIANRIHHETEK